ncbi:MAG: rod shape-determining protein MreC [Candidatus Vogelbacteria bacterium]|nr:rod shape-determining protein MreC [Candidatus Vogelbacteria bacterium]
MNYLAKNFFGFNRQRRGFRRFFRSPLAIIVIGAALWWLINQPTVYRFGQGVALALARPFWFIGGSVAESISQAGRFFDSRRALVAENNDLRRQTAKLEAVTLERDRLILDVQALREILNHSPSTIATRITATRVLTRPSQSPLGVIILDLGAAVRQPIAPDDLVIGAGAVALGRVAAVYPRTVAVKLFSAWGERLEVLIGSERIPAEARGRGGGNFTVFLPRDLAVAAGDPVMMIRGEVEYSLGRVSAVSSDPASAFQEILFRSPVNLDLLSWVEIRSDQQFQENRN